MALADFLAAESLFEPSEFTALSVVALSFAASTKSLLLAEEGEEEEKEKEKDEGAPATEEKEEEEIEEERSGRRFEEKTRD